VVENWMKENQIAIQSGLRAEIAENFMNGLKDLFVESYVDVPEAKEDLVDDLAEQVEELEDALNSQTAKNIEMTEELELFQRYEVIREHAHGLAETEVEKLAKLAEDLDYIDEETFSAKVKTIKDSYFTKEAKSVEVGADLVEDTADDAVEVSSSMNAYLQALRKTS
jgi:predicted nuclease with TOPRIM domain